MKMMNNHFHFLSNNHHRKLMELLKQEGLLNKDVNILYKVNNHVNDVVKDGYNWVTYRKGNELMVVANTKNGRIRLDEFIMEPEEGTKIHHINLNPLDNRRKNLEVKEL